jgi:hypothetical protein
LLLRREFRIQSFCNSFVAVGRFAFRQETNINPRKKRRGFLFLCFKKKLETVYIVFLSAITSCYNCCKKPVAAACKSCSFGFCGIAEIYWSALRRNFRQQFCGFEFSCTEPIMGSLMAGWSTNPLDAQSGLYPNL